jgi:hypothetical protein
MSAQLGEYYFFTALYIYNHRFWQEIPIRKSSPEMIIGYSVLGWASQHPDWISDPNLSRFWHLLGEGRSGIFSRWAQKPAPCLSIFLTYSTSNLYVKTHQTMTQRPTVTYLSFKSTSVHEIHDDFVVTLWPDTVSYSSVTRYLCEAWFTPSKPEPHPANVQRDLDDSDQVILAAFEDSPFASVQQLSRLTRLPSATVYRRFTKSRGFMAYHLR